MTRPDKLVFVAGTATEVGKTWWTARVASLLRTGGTAVAARKPAQSGDGRGPTDSEVLAEATGEHPDDVCPPQRTYRVAWAPPMAAAELGLAPYTVADLVRETAWAEGTQVGFVEGVGGPRSPIASDGDNVDLARALAPDLVVLVADAGLGTINAVRLSVPVFIGLDVVVALNRYEDAGLASRNRDLLAGDGYDIVTGAEELAQRLA
ncbi:MAG: dethiobiotin synthase [Acidimicrobiia bacterium]